MAENLRAVILDNRIMSMTDMSIGDDVLKGLRRMKQGPEVKEQERNPVSHSVEEIEDPHYKIRRIPSPRRVPVPLPINQTLADRIAPRTFNEEPRSLSAHLAPQKPVVEPSKFVNMMKLFSGKVNSAFTTTAKLDRDESYSSCVEDLPEGVYETRDSGVQTSTENLQRLMRGENRREAIHLEGIQRYSTVSSDSDEKSRSINSWVSQQSIDKNVGYPSLDQERPSVRCRQPAELKRHPAELKRQPAERIRQPAERPSQTGPVHPPNRLKKTPPGLDHDPTRPTLKKTSRTVAPRTNSDYLLFHIDSNTATSFSLNEQRPTGNERSNAHERSKRSNAPGGRSSMRDVMAKLKVGNDKTVSGFLGDRRSSEDEDIRRMF
jgi:hypothetical protein